MDQKRIVLFCHDGSGLGHLQRISRIARSIQGPFACLVITGMREVCWMVPKECEFIYLPSWNNLKKSRSAHWGREVWLNISLEDALNMKKGFIKAAIENFQPDAILVDYLPFGLHNELEDILINSHARKYLIIRGLIDSSDYETFFNSESEKIATVYQRILIAADKRIINFENEYPVTLENALTLLALQEGISSKIKDDISRGHGLIDFIGNCFELSDETQVAIISGRTAIKIDKKYPISQKNIFGRTRKVIALNGANDLYLKPDPNYIRNIGVNFNGVIIETTIPLNIR